MQRRDFIKTLTGVGVGAALVPPCKYCADFYINKNLSPKEKLNSKIIAQMPKRIRLEACSLCQLNCPACWVRLEEEKIKKEEGFGYLKFRDFKNLVDDNPEIEEIELSNSGEIFLNPELDKIIKYAYEKKVNLFANNGVNLNTLSDEMAETLVKYNFCAMSVSIDGATPDVYKIYRRGGDLNNVIANIKKINKYKKKYNSENPKLVYKFIIFNHNVEDIPLAKKLAKKLDMDICFIQNTQPWYAQLSDEQVKRAEKLSGLKMNNNEKYDVFMAELLDTYRTGKMKWFFCDDLFTYPQINWNGNFFGCPKLNKFGLNVFKIGLKKALKDKNVVYSKKMLLDFSVPPKKGVPCSTCGVYETLKKAKYEMYSDRDFV